MKEEVKAETREKEQKQEGSKLGKSGGGETRSENEFSINSYVKVPGLVLKGSRGLKNCPFRNKD